MEHSESIVLAFTIPIVIASLTLGRRWLIGTTSLAVACIVITAVGESLHVSWVKFFPLSSMQPFSWAVSVLLVLGVLVVLLDRFWDTLRGALMDATTRQQALELLQSSLEHTVAERTDSLAAALREVEQREARLTETIHELRASEALVREMRTPVIPVLAGVLVVPLVGALDELRTSDMSQQVLEQVERQRAQQVIFDVTGVPLVDTYVAGMLLRTAASIRLLGAQALLVGVRPEVAQTIVSLGSDLSSLPTYADLREAVEALILNSRSLGA
jgi:anti-anti-sigma factor